MMLAYIISNRRVSKRRDAAWEEEGTLFQNSGSFHKIFQRLNEKVGKESIDNIQSSESDTETEKTVELEDKDDTEVGKDKSQESNFQIENEGKQTLFHPVVYDDISKRNILAEARIRKPVLYSVMNQISALESIGNFEAVPRPADEIVIPIRELFVTKANMQGEYIAKVRIVARGDCSKIILTESAVVYSPVTSIIATRIFSMLAQTFPAGIHQLDVTSAFIYGQLPKRVFLELPMDHKERQGRKKVSMITINRDGLQENPRIWYNTVTKVFEQL
eukprot:augustus_masked-scaffold_1-processed-gene-23.13-mRNA-1 protein AED:1.00 eAED:1.00 QI:0/0/0/0/1/1/2/0/274